MIIFDKILRVLKFDVGLQFNNRLRNRVIRNVSGKCYESNRTNKRVQTDDTVRLKNEDISRDVECYTPSRPSEAYICNK